MLLPVHSTIRAFRAERANRISVGRDRCKLALHRGMNLTVFGAMK